MLNSIAEPTNTKSMDIESRPKIRQPKEANAESLLLKDSFSLSSKSQQLEALKASLKDEPEINAARVLYFKTEIDLGNYQIQSQNIAMKIFNQAEMA